MSRSILALCLVTTMIPVAAQTPPGTQRPGPVPGARTERPPRDPREPVTGTSVIRGRVVAADTGAPIRRVQVRATSGELRESRMASTDGQGRFELRDLPAGRWDLHAAKAGYVALRFGQRRPFESGRPLELGEGETMARADFVLPRAGVITGRILDEFGDPVAGARVMTLRYHSVQGTRRLVPWNGQGGETDDTGAFRVYGIPPGDYYVSATLRGASFVDDSSDTTGYAATYYPGTGNVAEAQRVAVPLGQEVSNISFALLPTRTVRITGTAIDSQGAPVTNGYVMLQESAATAVGFNFSRGGGRIRPNGSFTVSNVAPGSYTLIVNTSMGMGPADAEFATATVTVGEEDVSGINLVTGKGATATGIIMAAEGSSGKLSTAGLQVLPQIGPFETMMGSRPGRVEADGTFSIGGLHGKRMLRLTNLPPSWVVKTVLLDGSDVTDTFIDFKGQQEVSGFQILVTDRVTEVSGKVTTEKGEPTRDYTVVVFHEDREKWTFPSRYVRAGRADQEGLFKIRGLPPGSGYLALAVDYLEDGEAGDPEFLDRMRDRATELTLGDGEVKALDLKLIAR